MRPDARRLAYGRHLLRTYAISIEQYEEMLAAQDDRCAICRKAPPEGRRLAVDHDHDTGRVRGLLCTACNAALGSFPSADVLLAALSYLGEHS